MTGPVAAEASIPDNERPLGFAELRANVEGGIWDQVRLAAKFLVAKAANTAHEFLIDLPAAVLHEDDPTTYYIGKAKRNVAMLRDIGSWAVERELIPSGASAEAARSGYERLI